MPNNYFQFKQFTIQQEQCAMKVTTDACLFGAWAATLIQQEEISKTILDIGAGTGLLSLMIAQKNPQSHITAIEIDKNAAHQAKENSDASPWKDKINVVHADVKNFTPEKKYDLIISNPPFYENELQSGIMQKDIAHHSKDLTLSNLLQIIKMYLADNGYFYLLFPYKRNDEIENLFDETGLKVLKKTYCRQSVNHDFFRIMIRGSIKDNSVTEENEFSVKDSNQLYTSEFIGLLKEYYLHL